MLDYQSLRRSATRDWESRRLWYNLALVLPALLGYAPAELSAAVGDEQRMSSVGVAGLFVLSAVGANVCYTFAYALEFLFATDNPDAGWLNDGRWLCFVLGTLFAMMLAFIGGRNISFMQYH
jgi:hypothetical protein